MKLFNYLMILVSGSLLSQQGQLEHVSSDDVNSYYSYVSVINDDILVEKNVESFSYTKRYFQKLDAEGNVVWTYHNQNGEVQQILDRVPSVNGGMYIIGYDKICDAGSHGTYFIRYINDQGELAWENDNYFPEGAWTYLTLSETPTGELFCSLGNNDANENDWIVFVKPGQENYWIRSVPSGQYKFSFDYSNTEFLLYGNSFVSRVNKLDGSITSIPSQRMFQDLQVKDGILIGKQSSEIMLLDSNINPIDSIQVSVDSKLIVDDQGQIHFMDRQEDFRLYHEVYSFGLESISSTYLEESELVFSYDFNLLSDRIITVGSERLMVFPAIKTYNFDGSSVSYDNYVSGGNFVLEDVNASFDLYGYDVWFSGDLTLYNSGSDTVQTAVISSYVNYPMIFCNNPPNTHRFDSLNLLPNDSVVVSITNNRYIFSSEEEAVVTFPFKYRIGGINNRLNRDKSMNVDSVQFLYNEVIEEKKVNDFVLYPNPVSNVLQLNGSGIESLKVFDISGRLLISKRWNSQLSLDVSSLADGIYHLQIRANHETVSKSFIVKR